MGVTRRPNVISHGAAGDVTTEDVIVLYAIWNGSVTVGDDLEWKDGDGTVLNKVKSDGSGFQIIPFPFGKVRPDGGFETDVLDAGTVEYVLA